MIGSFADRRLKRLFERGEVRRLDPRDVDRIRLILQRLNLALQIEDLDLHSYRLHRLTGDLAGFWSITVRANWRIVFRFENGRAYEIELTDYH
jgi:toxin HigB-1